MDDHGFLLEQKEFRMFSVHIRQTKAIQCGSLCVSRGNLKIHNCFDLGSLCEAGGELFSLSCPLGLE